MRQPFFQVDGTPDKKKYFYGSSLLAFGMILGLINVVWIGMFLICCGGWLTWHSIHFGSALNLPKWAHYFLLFANVVISGTLVVLIVSKVLLG